LGLVVRIGIDARFLSHPQWGGFKRYTTNLVRALADVDRDDEYVVYVDRRPPDPDALPACPNFTYKTVHGNLPGVGMALREQVLLRGHVAADRLDLVHFLCNTATLALRAKHVVTVHDTIQLAASATTGLRLNPADLWMRAQTGYSRYCIRRVAPTASRVITVSSHVKSALCALLGVAPERVVVIYPAHDPLFTPVPVLGGNSAATATGPGCGVQSPYLLDVGYEPRKNIELLIEIFAELAAERRDLHLVVVAAHEGRRHELVGRVRHRGLEERAVILGTVDPACLARLYRFAEALVFPSESEGFGLPPLEAMASGIPIVAMRASSVPEVVGDAALLVEGADVRTWAGAVRQVLGSAALRAELVRRGLARAATFSWTRCAEQTIAVYRAVCAEAPGS